MEHAPFRPALHHLGGPMWHSAHDTQRLQSLLRREDVLGVLFTCHLSLVERDTKRTGHHMGHRFHTIGGPQVLPRVPEGGTRATQAQGPRDLCDADAAALYEAVYWHVGNQLGLSTAFHDPQPLLATHKGGVLNVLLTKDGLVVQMEGWSMQARKEGAPGPMLWAANDPTVDDPFRISNPGWFHQEAVCTVIASPEPLEESAHARLYWRTRLDRLLADARMFVDVEGRWRWEDPRDAPTQPPPEVR